MKRGTLTLSIAAAGILGFAAHGLALDRTIVSCRTSDGKYRLVITGEEQAGAIPFVDARAFVRTARGRLVGEYAVTYKRGSGSISFGHPSFFDSRTRGHAFLFDFPSTNTPYAFFAVLPHGETLRYGFRFAPAGSNQGTLSCRRLPRP